MNPNRVFLALTAGLLTVSDTRLAEAWNGAARYCVLDAVDIKTGSAAVVRDSRGQKTPLRQWVEQRRAEGVISVDIGTHRSTVPVCECDDIETGTEIACHDHSPHLMAGFAGGLPVLLEVQTQRDRTVHAQGTLTAPRLTLTASLFVRLIDRQAHPDFYWPIVLAKINQFRQCNEWDEVEMAALQTHLASSEGEHDWEFIGDDIFREIQVEALTADTSFALCAQCAALVEAVTPFNDERVPGIWLEIIEDDVNGRQLLRLIEAQGFSDRIWQIVSDKTMLGQLVGDEYELDDFPELGPAEWPSYLLHLSEQDSSRVCDELVEVIRLECERLNIQPIIPDDLSDVFGPDEEERRRLYFRERLQIDLGWRIRKNQERWMFYVLDPVDGGVAVNATPRSVQAKQQQSRQQFLAALLTIRHFASSVDSPFVDSFDFALHLATHAQGELAPDLNALQRSDAGRAPDEWSSVNRLVAMFAPFGWGADRLLGLAAISAADVFGGIGSWNDQEFSSEDEVRFHAVSEALFDALNQYYDALVSIKT